MRLYSSVQGANVLRGTCVGLGDYPTLCNRWMQHRCFNLLADYLRKELGVVRTRCRFLIMCRLRRLKVDGFAHGLSIEVRVRPNRSINMLALLCFRRSII